MSLMVASVFSVKGYKLRIKVGKDIKGLYIKRESMKKSSWRVRLCMVGLSGSLKGLLKFEVVILH